jgi:hypothetical protein
MCTFLEDYTLLSSLLRTEYFGGGRTAADIEAVQSSLLRARSVLAARATAQRQRERLMAADPALAAVASPGLTAQTGVGAQPGCACSSIAALPSGTPNLWLVQHLLDLQLAELSGAQAAEAVGTTAVPRASLFVELSRRLVDGVGSEEDAEENAGAVAMLMQDLHDHAVATTAVPQEQQEQSTDVDGAAFAQAPVTSLQEEAMVRLHLSRTLAALGVDVNKPMRGSVLRLPVSADELDAAVVRIDAIISRVSALLQSVKARETAAGSSRAGSLLSAERVLEARRSAASSGARLLALANARRAAAAVSIARMQAFAERLKAEFRVHDAAAEAHLQARVAAARERSAAEAVSAVIGAQEQAAQARILTATVRDLMAQVSPLSLIDAWFILECALASN